MQIRRNHIVLGAILMLLVGLGLLQRVAFVHEQVFVDSDVRFLGIDAWYHARLIEHEAVGLGPRLHHDPYRLAPAGSPVGVAPLFDAMAGALAKVALGFRSADPDSPSDIHTVLTVAAWFPALLGSLIVLPVFFLARGLWGAVAGWVAAIAILAVPGSMLSRSLLGFTDHHVAEVLFSSLTICFLSVGLHRASRRAGGKWPWAIAAGFSLAAYQLSWVAGILLPLVLGCWLGLASLLHLLTATASARSGASSSAVDLADATPLRDVASFTTIMATVSLICVWIAYEGLRVRDTTVYANALLAIAGLTLLVLPRLWERSRRVFALVCAAASLATWILLFGPPRIWDTIARFAWFTRGRHGANTVSEAVPMFSTEVGLSAIWNHLGMGWLIALPGLLFIAWKAIRHRSPGDLLVLVWTLTVFGLTLAQVRFTYYLSVCSVLAGAAFIGIVLRSPSPARHDSASGTPTEPAPTGPGAPDEAGHHRDPQSRSSLGLALAAIAILLLVVAPNVRKNFERMKMTSTIPNGWVEALDWMRTTTPDPFSGTECYYSSFSSVEASSNGCIADYAVFSWWDYGYWITQKGRRVPVANPSQAGAEPASIALVQEPESALEQLQEQNVRYVMVDADMGILQPTPELAIGKFPAIVQWSRNHTDDFFEMVRVTAKDGTQRHVRLYYERYFRTMVVQLILGGRAETLVPARVPVIELERPSTGIPLVRSVRFFSTYEEARNFLESAQTPPKLVAPPPVGVNTDWRIASFEPLEPPLELAALSGFEPRFESTEAVAANDRGRIPRVRIFEISPPQRRP